MPFINLPYKDTSFGEQFNTGLGQGLQSGIANLLDQLQQSQKTQRVEQALSQLPGISSQLAKGLAPLPESTLNTVLKELGREKNRAQEQQFLSSLGLSPALAGKSPQVQGAFIKDYLRKQEGKESESLLEGIRGTTVSSKPADSIDKLEQSPSLPSIAASASAPGAQAIKEVAPLKKALESSSYNPSQKSKIRQEIERIEDRFEKKQDKVDKATEAYYEKIKNGAEAIRESNDRLDRMLELVDSDKLPSPLVGSFLELLSNGFKGIALDLTGLLSPESQEFKKLQTDFLREAKSLFGARVTDNEINIFLKRIPSLAQSKEGKIRVINALKHFNEAGELRNDIMNEIIEENGGYRPNNIEREVEKRAKPRLDALAKEFKAGILKGDIEEVQSKEQARKTQARDAFSNKFDLTPRLNNSQSLSDKLNIIPDFNSLTPDFLQRLLGL